MEQYYKKIIVTPRVWKLIAVSALTLMIIPARPYPFGLAGGAQLWGKIFLLIFILTYLREERRATKSPDSNLVINWNLAEAVVFLLCLVGFIAFVAVRNLHEIFYYAYFNTGMLGLVSGVAAGEFLWQNTQLKQLDDSCRQRYWENYDNTIFLNIF